VLEAPRKKNGNSLTAGQARGHSCTIHGWSDPNDYHLIYEGQIVGRIYRMNSTGRGTVALLAQPTHGPNSGAADTLDDAEAAFRTAWERRQVRCVLTTTASTRTSLSRHANLSISARHRACASLSGRSI
jgi:hypothetical protein